MQQRLSYDVVIIGSGAAGLTTALRLPASVRIALISKGSPDAGATCWAQGGVAAVLDSHDQVDQHVQDTLAAGGGLSDASVARHIVSHGRESIDWLISQGVPFTTDGQATGYHLTREGGHSTRRIIHVADATGKAISDTLLAQVASKTNIDLFTHCQAIDLLTSDDGTRCIGICVFDLQQQQTQIFSSYCTVLACGGASGAYLFTSNSDGASGDGIAMAWRSGCRVANLEFNQFHPTCLYHPDSRSMLISEALRGEGGLLKRPDGSCFMPGYDPHAELAPRDIVARAMDQEMKQLGAPCLYLDISHKPAPFIRTHFPTIYQRCLSCGINITTEPIPVVPAAHYTCGGIVVDQHGQTDIRGLFAVGECSFTGLHGANRLASNSLLECFVLARSCANRIGDQLSPAPDLPSPPEWQPSRQPQCGDDGVCTQNLKHLRRLMWDHVGIVRTTSGLQKAMSRVRLLQAASQRLYRDCTISKNLLELRNLTLISELIVRCAMARKESRGLHYSLNYPALGAVAKNTILTPGQRAWRTQAAI